MLRRACLDSLRRDKPSQTVSALHKLLRVLVPLRRATVHPCHDLPPAYTCLPAGTGSSHGDAFYWTLNDLREAVCALGIMLWQYFKARSPSPCIPLFQSLLLNLPLLRLRLKMFSTPQQFSSFVSFFLKIVRVL